MRKRKYTDNDLILAVKESKSAAEVLRRLGLKQAGGTQAHIKRLIKNLKLDTSHWTESLWSKGRQLKKSEKYSRASTLKPHLIRNRGHKCEKCKNTHWLEKEIVLETHHIDGDTQNNVEENLQLLCCNCHAQTDSWRKSAVIKSDDEIIEEAKKHTHYKDLADALGYTRCYTRLKKVCERAGLSLK